MKICPQCKNEYDDTWKVCLKCGIPLSEATNTSIPSEQFLKFARDTDIELQKLSFRLERIPVYVPARPIIPVMLHRSLVTGSFNG